MIGETTIDLEDRWFHKKWQAIGGSGEATEEQRKSTGAPKYIEARDLHHPTKSNSQGKLYFAPENADCMVLDLDGTNDPSDPVTQRPSDPMTQRPNDPVTQ